MLYRPPDTPDAPFLNDAPLLDSMGVGYFGRRAAKHVWESLERSQIGHPSVCSTRSDRVLIKLDASIGERNICSPSTRRKCIFDGHLLALLLLFILVQ